MAVGYKCWQCEHYEGSRRNSTVGICHDADPCLVHHRLACRSFRLREWEPPEEVVLEPFAEENRQVTDLTAKVDGLAEETRALTKRVGKLEALDRFDDRRATRLCHDLDELRVRIEQLEEVSHDHMA